MSDGISIDTSSFAKFARDLARVDLALKAEMRKEMKAAGEIVATEARARAGFSTRIPGSIKVGVAGNKIRVYAQAKKAPEAKPLENGGQDGTFRHPVFGDRQNWVSQPARPFLRPALEANGAAAVAAAKRAVETALR